jgi:hypothetical protein
VSINPGGSLQGGPLENVTQPTEDENPNFFVDVVFVEGGSKDDRTSKQV